jgi:hypothetical protein
MPDTTPNASAATAEELVPETNATDAADAAMPQDQESDVVEMGEEGKEPASQLSDGGEATNGRDDADLGADGQEAAPADWDILILLQMGSGPGGSLMRPLVQDLIQRLGGLEAGRQPGSRIDVWLDSPGGDAHAAYKLGLYLRSRFEVVNFVVVDYAKSAATLLALAGDSIFMAPAAELGPLDTQESREGEVRMRSNLDTANTIDNVYWQVVTNAILAGSEILRSTALTREQTIQHVLDFSAQFARPLLEQIDLVSVNAASTSLDVAIEYGARLLSYRHERNGFASARARVSQLVRGYPTHGYVIDRDEARDGLGLPVRNIEEYELLPQLEAFYAGAQSASINIVQLTTAAEVSNGEDNGDDAEQGSEGDGSAA